MSVCTQCKGRPRCNSGVCWDRFFATRMGATMAYWSYAETHGFERCVAAMGSKFVKHLRRFMENKKV